MRRIFLITFKVLVMFTVNFQLVAATYAESVVSANMKCVDFGFKQNTKDYEDCVKQVMQSSGSSKPAAKSVVNQAPTQSQLDDKFWDGALAAGNKEGFQAYLNSYPKGRYAELARANLLRLNEASKEQQRIAFEALEKERAANEASQKLAAEALENERTAKEAAQKLAVEEAKKRAVAEAALEKQRLVAEAAQRKAPSNPTSSQTIKDCFDCPELVVIPAGSFTMGSDENGDEKPPHSVYIRSFLFGRTEVKQKQWLDVMGSNPSRFTACGPECPVENVKWDEVQQFIFKLNQKTGKKYRLPSEAEWEYAARAGTTTEWSHGNDESKLGNYAWYGENSGSKAQEVGQKLPNAFGLYDMHGNVWEWTQDCWHTNYSGAPTDGSAWTTGCTSNSRVLRGGSLGASPAYLRSTFRLRVSPDLRISGNGFRLARDI